MRNGINHRVPRAHSSVLLVVEMELLSPVNMPDMPMVDQRDTHELMDDLRLSVLY